MTNRTKRLKKHRSPWEDELKTYTEEKKVVVAEVGLVPRTGPFMTSKIMSSTLHSTQDKALLATKNRIRMKKSLTGGCTAFREKNKTF